MKLLRPHEMAKMIVERGWVFARARGSHRQYSRPGFPIITIPFHPGNLHLPTQLAIMKASGITREEIENR